MGDINLTVGELHGPTSPQSQSFTRTLMGNMYINPADMEPPRYHIHLYTISRREFTVQQPPLLPSVIIPACKQGERYRFVFAIPHPFLQGERHPDKNEGIIYKHEAERVAQSICNPNNPTLDQDFVNRSPLGLGVDLNAQGVFWSRNNPPTDEEIRKAEARREKYYTALLEQARVLEVSNPKELEMILNPDFHMAAEYFGVETPWHRKMVAKVECPNCGEPIKSASLAYHVNSLGLLCIIDEARAAKAIGSQEQSSPVENGGTGGTESPSRPRRTRRVMQSPEEAEQ